MRVSLGDSAPNGVIRRTCKRLLNSASDVTIRLRIGMKLAQLGRDSFENTVDLSHTGSPDLPATS